MKKSLTLTPTNIRRMKSMLNELFNEYKYITIKKNGMIIFKKNWYNRPTTIHVFELCVGELPKRLILYRVKSTAYKPVFDTLSELIIRCHSRIDIINVLWQHYLKLKFPIVVCNNAHVTLSESRVVACWSDIPGSDAVLKAKQQKHTINSYFKDQTIPWYKRLFKSSKVSLT